MPKAILELILSKHNNTLPATVNHPSFGADRDWLHLARRQLSCLWRLFYLLCYIMFLLTQRNKGSMRALYDSKRIYFGWTYSSDHDSLYSFAPNPKQNHANYETFEIEVKRTTNDVAILCGRVADGRIVSFPIIWSSVAKQAVITSVTYHNHINNTILSHGYYPRTFAYLQATSRITSCLLEMIAFTIFFLHRSILAEWYVKTVTLLN